jgi:hypothetical protein
MWIVRASAVVRESFMWVVRSFILWVPLVRDLFIGSYSCASCASVGSFFRSCGSLFGSAFRAGFIRWVIFVGLLLLVTRSCMFRWLWASLPSLFHVGYFIREFSCGFEVRTLGGEFLKGIFAL